MKTKKLTIGLFGFGVVGEGIYKVLQETPSLEATIKKICIKHPEKKREAPAELFTTDSEELLGDETINLIVELIDHSEQAFAIVSRALQSGKAVVSANKKMIAEHFKELLFLQENHDAALLYEAAVCGSIPVIRNLEEYYDNDMLKNICGIVNGSTNFILTRITREGASYAEALLKAQQLGFAESNPALDVNGIDASNKLVILLLHAYGLQTKPKELFCKGITSIQPGDRMFALEKKYRIKLAARAVKLDDGRIAAMVMPHFVTPDSQLYNVLDENNGVVIETGLADKQFLYGKGAGRYPTSSAVLSDIAALRYGYKYEYRKLNYSSSTLLASDYFVKVFVSFDDWQLIDRSVFESIEEWHATGDRNYLIGTIHFLILKNAAWFAYKDVSVIMMPDGILESRQIEERQLQKRSLVLAGVPL